LIEDDGSTFITGAQGAYVCAPCHYTLDGATRKQNINLDNRFLAAGGPGYGTKSGYALLDVNGDADAVSLTSLVSNSHTSAFDLSITGLVPEEIIAPQRLGVGSGPAGVSAVRLAVAPNPTRTTGGGDRSVSLSFQLPQAGAIELAIYDMSGRRVATPARGTFDAGDHRSTWGRSRRVGHRGPARCLLCPHQPRERRDDFADRRGALGECQRGQPCWSRRDCPLRLCARGLFLAEGFQTLARSLELALPAAARRITRRRPECRSRRSSSGPDTGSGSPSSIRTTT
jgi:hypothetical protein